MKRIFINPFFATLLCLPLAGCYSYHSGDYYICDSQPSPWKKAYIADEFDFPINENLTVHIQSHRSQESDSKHTVLAINIQGTENQSKKDVRVFKNQITLNVDGKMAKPEGPLRECQYMKFMCGGTHPDPADFNKCWDAWMDFPIEWKSNNPATLHIESVVIDNRRYAIPDISYCKNTGYFAKETWPTH